MEEDHDDDGCDGKYMIPLNFDKPTLDILCFSVV